MEQITSHAEFLAKSVTYKKSLLLLHKPGSDQGSCAMQNLEKAMSEQRGFPVFAADVTVVRDIHPNYGITSVPSLLIFEEGKLVSVIKGCQESSFYKALAEGRAFQARTGIEGKASKSVTVYSTPTCSWCNTLKSWLKQNRISFTDIDISRDEKAAQNLVRRSGQQGVPQTEINGQIVVGFNQPRLKELLEIQ